MVPLGPPLLSYRSNCKAMLNAVDDAVQLVVDRPYKSGDPIVVWYDAAFPPLIPLNFYILVINYAHMKDILKASPSDLFSGIVVPVSRFLLCILQFCRCGPQPNSKLLINYGFVDDDNSYDRLVFEVYKNIFS